MNNEKLIVTLDGGIKRITFNQSEKRNSFDAVREQLTSEISDYFGKVFDTNV